MYWGSLAGVQWLGRDVEHNLRQESRLRRSGAILVLTLHAFMAWAGTTLRASFLVHGCQEYRLYRAELFRPVAPVITDFDCTWKQSAV